MTQEIKPWISLKFDFNKEQRKQFNKQIDQIAFDLGYAVVNPYGSLLKIGTLEQCQDLIDYFIEQDSRCGCEKSTDLEIVDINQIHWKTRRTYILHDLESNFNFAYRSGNVEEGSVRIANILKNLEQKNGE
jgi:hypothetical protein